MIGRRISSTLRPFIHGLAQRAARAYVVGPDLADAMKVCRSLDAKGSAATICAWNGEDDQAPDNAARCLNEIKAIALEQLNCYVSLKAHDLRFSQDLVAQVADQARDFGVGIHFDSMGPEAADRTFSLIDDLRRQNGNVGCTIPSRWMRSLDDAARAAQEGWRVRVVKGQWPDPREPGIDARANFLRIVDRLAGQAREVAVATHDPVLAREALGRLRAKGTASELELLFGLPLRRTIPVAKETGVPLRIYVPYGHAWLPYAIGQVRKNPRISFWIIRDLLTGYRSGLDRLEGDNSGC
jgi:proline dehydrogenase